MTVVEVTAFPTTVGGVEFGAVWNTLFPAVGILLALDLALGAVAVVAIRRASSSDVR